MLRRIEALEKDRADLVLAAARADEAFGRAMAASKVSEHEVRRFLVGVADGLKDDDRAAVKAELRKLVERIELDPKTLQCRVHYRMRRPSRVGMASPRDAEPNPGAELWGPAFLAA